MNLNTPYPQPETALGSLLAHITGGGDQSTYQPMNINFGLFPPLEETDKEKSGKLVKSLRGKERKAAYAKRALQKADLWLNEISQ